MLKLTLQIDLIKTKLEKGISELEKGEPMCPPIISCVDLNMLCASFVVDS